MNVVAIIPEFYPEFHGGLGRFAEYYAKYLSKKVDSFYIIAINERCKLMPYEKIGSITIYRPLSKIISLLLKINKNKLIFNILQLTNVYYYQVKAFFIARKINKKEKIDIISIHDWCTCVAGILSKRFIKVPLVFHVHSTELSMTKFYNKTYGVNILNMLEKNAAKMADMIIIASKQMQKLLAEHGWDEKKMEIVPYGVETSFDISSLISGIKGKADFFSRLFNDIDDKSKIIVFAGRLVQHKGIYELLEAFSIVLKTDDSFKMVILGAGENGKVQSAIEKYGIKEKVYAYYEFLDKDELMKHYYYADLCIFPSFYEPFGMVAIEAMSLGKPTILGNGYSDIFFGTESDPSACKVDSKSPDDIASKILKLEDDKKLQKKLSVNGKKFSDNFDQEKIIDKMLDLYKSVSVR